MERDVSMFGKRGKGKSRRINPAERVKPAEHIFVNEYLRNGNDASKAFRVAYPNAAEPVKDRAKALLSTMRVQHRLKEVVEKMDREAQYKRADAMRELEQAIALATEVRNPSAMIQATKLKSQLAGLLVEKHEIAVTRFDELDLNEREAALEAVKEAVAKAKLTAALS